MHQPKHQKSSTGSTWPEHSLTMLCSSSTPGSKMKFMSATKDSHWSHAICWENHWTGRLMSRNSVITMGKTWERLWMDRAARGEEIPDRVASTLALVDQEAFVNIFEILQILATIPISSSSCERSISSLRYLKNYLRNTMSHERLNGLALMYTHRDMNLDLDRIIDLFANLHPRRMRMANILQDGWIDELI